MPKAKTPAPLTRKALRRTSVAVEGATWQLGGGAVPKEAEGDAWLRSTAVRGGLHFWWRAIYACTFEDATAMLDAERAIFGGPATKTTGPGKLSVALEILQSAQDARSAAFGQGDARAVAYFPGQGMGDAESTLRRGGRAVIEVSEQPTPTPMSDAQWAQVLNALRAFVLFGGSGSRTRKGAGSLVVADLAPSGPSLDIPNSDTALATWLGSLPRGRAQMDVFSLGERRVLMSSRHNTADQAHTQLLEMWRDFRQDRPHPESWGGGKGWGRTRWPEADAMRFIQRTHSLQHPPDPANRGKGPRAHLGLPIVIKFKDDKGPPGRREPSRTELGDRYASPVLLSVARFRDGYQGLVVVTPSTLGADFRVKVANSSEELVTGPWTEVWRRLQAKLHHHKFNPVPERT